MATETYCSACSFCLKAYVEEFITENLAKFVIPYNIVTLLALIQI